MCTDLLFWVHSREPDVGLPVQRTCRAPPLYSTVLSLAVIDGEVFVLLLRLIANATGHKAPSHPPPPNANLSQSG